MRRRISGLAVAVLTALSLSTAACAADARVHRLAIQVDQNDPAVMNLALNNATNVIQYYRDKGEEVEVDLVTYGPGLNMLRADTSPVKERIKLRDPGAQGTAPEDWSEGLGQGATLVPQSLFDDMLSRRLGR